MATTSILQEATTSQQSEGQLWEEECFQIGCAKAREEAQRRLQVLEARLHQQRPQGWMVVGWRERTLITRFGEIRVRRRLYRDRAGAYHWLLDEHLGWARGQVATPSLTQSALELAAQVPFRQAATTLAHLTAGVLSTMTVHRLVQQWGQRAIVAEEAEWRACFERGAVEEQGQQVVETLYTEADGVWVHLQRERQKHYELKSAIAYTGWERLKQREERYRLVNKRVYCHANSRVPFWEGAALEWAKGYDLSRVQLVVVGGDGANWIAGEEVSSLGRVVTQLDGYHLARACGRALGKQAGGQLYQAIRGGPEAAARKLLAGAEPSSSKGVAKARAYVEAHIHQGMDWRQRAGVVPQGARSLGTMESNGDKLVANRMKKRGMSWSICGAQRLAKVVQLRANGTLDSLWESGWRPPACKPQRGPEKTASARAAKGQWLRVTIPALTGPASSRPWVQALRALAYPDHRLN
jgi:hypothetical protein